MKLVFIDSEPPLTHGGGIRTYLLNHLSLAQSAGITTVIYTHNIEAYKGYNAKPIHRKPCLSWPWLSIAHRWFYGNLVNLEYAYGLVSVLEQEIEPHTIFEFPDYGAYGFFCFQSPRLALHSYMRIHTPSYLISPAEINIKKRLQGYVMGFCERWAIKRSPTILALSAAFMQEKLPWIKSYKTLLPTLPSLANMDSITPLADSSFPNKSALQISKKKSRRLLFIGRIENRKGVHVLVSAFLNFVQSHPDYELQIIGSIGEPSYYQTLLQQQNQHPQGQSIQFLPTCTRSELFQSMQEAFCLIIPSLWENCPNVFFEGLAAGIFCLVSATGEMKTLGEKMGLPLFKPGDSESLEEALIHITASDFPRPNFIEKQNNFLRQAKPQGDLDILNFYHEKSA